ncbi:MAG: RipA family octameric membrane protein [Blastocatellia bacterium]
MENAGKPDKVADALLNKDLSTTTTNPETLLSYRFQQYSLFLQLADKISERRQNANSIFLTINTGICAVVAYLFSGVSHLTNGIFG